MITGLSVILFSVAAIVSFFAGLSYPVESRARTNAILTAFFWLLLAFLAKGG